MLKLRGCFLQTELIKNKENERENCSPMRFIRRHIEGAFVPLAGVWKHNYQSCKKTIQGFKSNAPVEEKQMAVQLFYTASFLEKKRKEKKLSP